jgi:hypothetical protein
MITGSNRFTLYESRVNAALDGLTRDIESWQTSLPEGTAVRHHVAQFGQFSRRAYQCLMQAYENRGGATADERVTFSSLVTGVFTSQWMQLRQVAHQRLAGSPYRQQLEFLDQKAAGHYHLLRHVSPKGVRERLSLCPPLIYLGRLAELTLFSRRAPTVLTVPFGAPYSEQTALAVPHEVGHAFCSQISGLFPELKRRVQDSLAKTQPDQQQKVLHEMILGWLPEMVSDSLGAMLAGPDFGESALWVSVSPDETVGVSDAEHPVALIRPYVHLETFRYLYGSDDPRVKKLADQVEQIVKDHLDRRLESGPVLTVVSLRTVRDEMIKVLGYMLDSTLDALAGRSLGQLMRDGASTGSVDTDVVLPAWGEISDEECQQLVLELPASLRPDFATPIVPHLKACCVLHLWFCC